MAFSSKVFLFGFLPLTLLCYFLLPQRWRTGRNLVLLVFSLNNTALFVATALISLAVLSVVYTLVYRATSNAYYRIVKSSV